jgi:hypothetical protein
MILAVASLKKLSGIAGVLILSGVIVASASASLRTYIVGSKHVTGVGTVGTLRGTVKKPYKIILYCGGANARCGANVACFRGTKEFDWSRSNLGPYTWNLKKKTWYRMDRCQFTTTIKSGFNQARITVQATVRS